MDYDDYLREQAIKYRQVAEAVEESLARAEFLELAAICEEIANNIEDRMTAG
jgi:dihydroneopterin aldolase